MKLSDDYSVRCGDLSDAAYRTHTDGLVWTMKHESGGLITDRALRQLADSPAWSDAVEELVRCGFWDRIDGGYLIRQSMEHQVEPEVMAARRQADALRQQRRRRKAAGITDPQDTSRRDTLNDDTRDTPHDVTPGVTRDPGLVGSGLDRKPTAEAALDESTKPVCSEVDCSETWGLLAGRCRTHHNWAYAR